MKTLKETQIFNVSLCFRGLYFEKHLKFIKLSSDFVPFTKLDLTYLLKDKYDEPFVKKVYSALPIKTDELANSRLDNGQPLPSAVRIAYSDQKNFKSIAKMFKIMEDAKVSLLKSQIFYFFSCKIKFFSKIKKFLEKLVNFF